MPPIRVLSEALVNLIAAGEVIERPAAAVKELVENALDAGAMRITVVLEGGGIDYIEVTDDGTGMDPAALGLAVQRHATSKLVDDDLTRIATLGFRGEALPSIGAAARLAILSRPAGADSACLIRVEGGRVFDVTPAAGPPGTRVVVRDLFFATPARRKFLKHPRTEADHAEVAVRRLALAAPGVAFRLQSDGRCLFDVPAQDRAARVGALLGTEAAGALLAIAAQRGSLRLEGFACAPTVSRATATAQVLTVNGRPVADPTLRTAVRVAYRTVIEFGRHPVVALWIDLPAEEVDVNVHPNKAELRFRDPAAVRGLVISALSQALAAGAGRATNSPALPHRSLHRPSGYEPARAGRMAPLLPEDSLEARLQLSTPPATRVMEAPAPQPDQPLGAALAQVLDTYIIALDTDGSLVLVDQHAAHERLTHEAIRTQMLGGRVRTQPLLLPAVIELPPSDTARLLARADELTCLGLEIEEFGPGAILVRALPAALGAPEPGALLRDIADELAEQDEQITISARLDAVIARLACHGSVRAGRRLTQAEMNALLRQMECTPRAATCSHGRPTFLKLTRGEIEKLFGRR